MQSRGACKALFRRSNVGGKPVFNFGTTMFRVMLAIAAACVVLPRVTWGQEIDELLQQATQASQRGEHERAIARLSDAISSSPKTSIAWYLRGREHFRAGQI